MGVRSAVLEPVFGSATAAGREVAEWDAAVRVPLPLCRRLGFVQLAAGSGASTTAARVATVLATRRPGMVLAVDASPSPAGLLDRVGVAPLPAPPGAAATRAGARTAAQARAGLGRARSGCYGLDLRPAPGRPGPAPTAAAWAAAVGPVARFYDVVLTDWGLRHPAYDLEPVLTSSHAVCLVVPAVDAALDAAAALLHGLAARPATPPVAVAVVHVAPGARPARALPAPVVAVPYEPRPHRPARPYRTGILRLAARLTDPGSRP